MNATSGRSSLRERTRPPPASSETTSWPSDASASSTLAPERRDTCRSSELPPFRTATFIRRSGLPARAAQGHHVSGLGGLGKIRETVLGGDRLVQLDLLADDGSDAPDPLTDLV